jgi:hypothetical protein
VRQYLLFSESHSICSFQEPNFRNLSDHLTFDALSLLDHLTQYQMPFNALSKNIVAPSDLFFQEHTLFPRRRMLQHSIRLLFPRTRMSPRMLLHVATAQAKAGSCTVKVKGSRTQPQAKVVERDGIPWEGTESVCSRGPHRDSVVALFGNF